VGWKTFESVTEAVGRRAGKKLTRHALTQAVYRLRRTFLINGVNPFLVQTNRRAGGLRLAVRHADQNRR
jgi:DNA-binding winged helix-turn-helix (wHTH) protein